MVILVLVILVVGLSFVFRYEGHIFLGSESGAHNCLTASGFYWNESELACVRDLSKGVVDERFQIHDFGSCFYAVYGIMESFPKMYGSEGRDFFEE
ncbi:MAG: hypothetical protein V1888_01780 [archaeon]